MRLPFLGQHQAPHLVWTLLCEHSPYNICILFRFNDLLTSIKVVKRLVEVEAEQCISSQNKLLSRLRLGAKDLLI